MTHRTLALGAALMAAGALATQAVAHDATVTCDPATGTYVVDADYRHLTPVAVFDATSVSVSWSDGWRVVRPLPAPCTAPTPPPAPPAPEPQPEPVSRVEPTPTKQPTVVKRPPKRVPVKRVKRPRVITCTFVIRHYRGAARARMIQRLGLPASCGRPYNPPVAG